MEDTKDNNDHHSDGVYIKGRTADQIADQPAEVQEKFAALQIELAEEKNRHLRTRADFENYRKRIERDAETSRLQIKKEILLDLLNFIDYFDQARKQLQDQAAAAGLEIMARQFSELLQKHGVRPVECIGLPFDPETQEGVGFLETEACPEGCVAEEICSGYKLGDLLLKPARVMVAK
ncbi:MAG: nucleotide exchange factor GrpE [Firmicutes bacterium]|nr:nucleotide exchange factor GrpE [Bacillota bacterium]